MPAAALDALEAHGRDRMRSARTWRERGGRALGHVGADVPRELIAAAGLLPVRLTADPEAPTPRADAAVGGDGLGWRARALLEQLLDTAQPWDGVVLAHDVAEHAQLYAALRELGRLGQHRLPRHVWFVDLRHLVHQTTTRYNRTRIGELHAKLERLTGGTVGEGALRAAVADGNEQRRLLAQASALRRGAAPRLTGAQALRVTAAAMVMPVAEHTRLLRRLLQDASALPAHAGRRLLVCGSAHETTALYELVERRGAVVVGEDHDRGDAWFARLVDETAAPLDALAAHCQAATTTAAGRSAAARVEAAVARALDARAEAVLHVTVAGDHAAPWEVPRLRAALAARRIPLLAVTAPAARPAADADLAALLAAFVNDPGGVAARSAAAPVTLQAEERRRGEAAPGASPGPSASSAPRPADGPPRGQRSRKALAAVASFGVYQREWFARTRERAAAGEPLAVVNADSPQEILRAMDIPYVVNQWWASIVAAKQRTADHLRVLRAHGYPGDAEAYSAMGLAAALDPEAAGGPWGGLPVPRILQATAGTDATRRLFEVWAERTGADLYLLERTVDCRWDLPVSWWVDLPRDWDRALEPARLDLLQAELGEVIRRLERTTGRRFSEAAFVRVMELVNEQEEYYRRTRDLIAATIPAPVSVVDTMPATMLPQWHRGTEWGRDAARALYEEVAARVAAGAAACPDERVRLAWVGRGLWGDMGFYQRFESSHGAVFVWSMYLGLAADGYLRSLDGGRDPLRALASRFVTMGDELRMPTWAGAWHVKEAELHGVDGAVAIADADPFVLRALQRAGVPVLRLAMDNIRRAGAADGGDAGNDAAREVAAFLEGPAAERAAHRRGQA